MLGTRPEIIKFSPIIRECTRVGLEFSIIHTGQHYSHNMDTVFFEQLELPTADCNLEVGSGTHAEQTGKMLIGIERVLLKQKPQIVLVEGDTNTVLAGALAATKLGIKVGHVEAGLRSYDRQMPEETNRTLADHCSDLLFAPTAKARDTLLNERIPKQKIFVTGNTIVDAVKQNIKIANEKRKTRIQKKLDLKPRTYFAVTIHRQENVDNPQRLHGIVEGLEKVQKDTGYPIVYPIHPRTKKNLKKLCLQFNKISTIDPLDYLSFLRLESNARLVLTDSGGVQEEACTLNVPCVTLRDNTERPETLEVGSNILAGTNPDKIVKCTRVMLEKKQRWKNPFGDGKAGERIVKILETERGD
ncbi:MAG TPA: UDP-N-acetylglucosamine 2-epimerase (non-hydrolyzing) [Candidatus Bathyarchaeia archaeon]|nr:UDP-N-acetylglucosamine 2-epimerase (non-hydrolyzing) [Candidatus Bathyarchaeia archaeon]